MSSYFDFNEIQTAKNKFTGVVSTLERITYNMKVLSYDYPHKKLEFYELELNLELQLKLLPLAKTMLEAATARQDECFKKQQEESERKEAEEKAKQKKVISADIWVQEVDNELKNG